MNSKALTWRMTNGDLCDGSILSKLRPRCHHEVFLKSINFCRATAHGFCALLVNEQSPSQGPSSSMCGRSKVNTSQYICHCVVTRADHHAVVASIDL